MGTTCLHPGTLEQMLVLRNEANSEKVKKLPLQKIPHDNYEYFSEEPSESESDHNIAATPGSFGRNRWSSEDGGSAGPSQTVSPQLPDTHKIVTEGELDQLAQIRPLIFNFHEQSAIKDCLKMLEKKVAEYGIIQEFMDLEFKNLPGEFIFGNQRSNKEKNRYRDILPYDSTRVPLGKGKDYINASYIRIVNYEEEYFYIASQGPLPGTVDDFWQMVFENNSNIIAMITREIEGGIIKCYHYWPTSPKKPLELKCFRIFLENYQILQYFTIRMFQIVEKSTGTSHLVKHLQFTKWPDHGTPASVDGFIKYVRYVRKSHLMGPLVVHCSAGVGRTGVFLCVDVVFCAIEKNYSFDIVDIVTQMREQRRGMIQTKEQYHFCYEIVLKVLQKLLTLD
ncbi:tyrosine-protein phosphatase non-receptor type 20 isoform X2 [Lemur catta]|uniref:tyrosine-protein phosphatase non-receptor type 20 isoform X2 n=1 Tax=Lemur catta TaxID=9447 RepID=UPI001E26C1F8|nr:tyrosine-protein phosphatase non-receptor type 20 isoform X2 [Lemur catta]